jgi:adenylate cyclase
MQPDRSIATILFTDIVGSTERAAELGDRGWRDLLAQHHELVRQALRRYHGREIATTGDGFLAIFDAAERAILCACAIRDAVREMGLEVRCGLHMGEVEQAAGGDIAGIAVHVGARVSAQAGPGEVLVTSGVRDAELGSGFGFEDRGQHELKGVPGQWTLYEITSLPREANELSRNSAWSERTVLRAETVKSIAVLPFANMSADPENEFFSDGVSEELINRLTKLPQLRVSSRTTSFCFKGKNLPLRTIAEELGVKALLEGSVRRAGNRIRITAQLIDTASDFHLWSETYDRELEDIFAVQDEIAHNIVEALQVTLSPKEKRAIEKLPTTDVQAYDYYLRGRTFFHQQRGGGLELARQMFSQAIEIDPEYAPAHAGIADCAAHLYSVYDKNEAHLKQAEAASRRAVELGPKLAGAHASRGFVLSLRRRYDEAEEEFKTAIQLDPKLFEAYYFYARAAFAQSELEKAARLFEKAVEVRPEDYQAASLLHQVYTSLGMESEAKAAAQRGLRIVKRHVELYPGDSRALGFGAATLVKLGETERGLDWADRVVAMNPDDASQLYNVACTYSVAGEVEKSLDCLEKTVGAVTREWIENDSDFEPVRSHPRFQALLKQME